MNEQQQAEVQRCLKAAKRIQGSIRRYGSDSENWDAWTEDFEACLREVMRIDPTNIDAPTLLGMHYLIEREEPEIAITHLATALTIRPNDKKLLKAIKEAKAKL